MKAVLVLSVLVLSTSLWARGPMPHERTATPKSSNAHSGRFLYLGDAPKFEGSELEMTVSKLNLTTRITAHVSQEKIDGYAQQMFLRWKTISDSLMDPVMSLHPLIKISQLAEGKGSNNLAWSKIAEQYSSHILEETGKDIYLSSRNAKNYVSNQSEDQYKETISEAYFKFLFKTNEPSENIINDNKKLEILLSKENSRRLFQQHLGHLFTRRSLKTGYLGTLTFVYPIAATVEGPFDQPKEQITDLKSAESLEARWWSDKWQDEFGGFPFLLIEWSGVAFHGPITNYSPLDVWFLRRGYVSHGCHRMDSSDLLEMRALMPYDLKKAAGKIKVTILNHFDVTDWNNDGKEEVMDVKYYQVPTSISVQKGKTVEETVKPYLVDNQKSAFLKNNKYAAKFYNEATDKLQNIPRYNVSGKVLVKEGVHAEVPLFRFDYRPNRIIQYTEEGIILRGYDDLSGKYPPKYFQKY